MSCLTNTLAWDEGIPDARAARNAKGDALASGLAHERTIAVMKRFWLFVVCAAAVCRVNCAAELDVVPIQSIIRHVTVYADRARVVRRTSLSLEQGRTVYELRGLPGWTDEGSIRLALQPASAGRISDVHVRRDYLARADNEELRAAEAAAQKLTDDMAALDDESNVLDQLARHVEAIRVFSLAKLPEDVAIRNADVTAYGKVVDFVGESLRELARARREIERQRRELQPELTASQRRHDDLKRRTQLEICAVQVAIEATAAREAGLALTYMLPGATWEPAHELRASTADPGTVQFASHAVVSQSTGEDWDGAELSFSTQSPMSAVRIPELEALLLGSASAVAHLRANQTASFLGAQQRFKGQNQRAWDSQAAMEQRAQNTFHRLQKRGTTAHFLGRGRPVVRSDGRPVRVPIGELDLAATHQIMAAPEASLNAARTVETTNSGVLPLLPGQVFLYRDGAFLGLTDLDFVAEGESFAVFLGVADHIKLARVLDKQHSSFERGRRTKMQIAFEVSAENLSDAPVSLRLADRIPVSEDKDIRVHGVKITPDGEPDAKGLLTWDITLQAKDKKVYRIQYSIEYPPEALQKVKQRASSSATPSAIYQQIEDLEMMMK